MTELLSNNYWTLENYRQRMDAKTWRKMLLENDDIIAVNGHIR